MTNEHSPEPQVCETCEGSGCHPVDFHQPDPPLGQLRPCPDCDGRGETER